MRSWFKSGSRLRWLYPGLRVKRWLLVILIGITILALGAGYLLRDIYTTWTFPPIVRILTLQFVPRVVRAVLFGCAGLILTLVGLIKLNRSLLGPFLRSGQDSVVDVLYERRRRQRGPRVVAIGGGTGLSTLLRGLKEYTDHITAIVTVADDGGSSGRLRRELRVLPPGDFRKSIASLSDAEALTTQLFQYRFGTGEGLNGHSFGNLFIAAMVGITGSFERALTESSRVLAVRGRILPSTLEDVTLCADLHGEDDGRWFVEGESSVTAALPPIERVFLRPDGVRAYPEAVRAILEADLIVLGPGSLFTSLLPNLLVRDIRQAIRASRALRVYVCNVATQRGETDGFGVTEHVAALQRHVGQDLFPYILVNDNLDVELPPNPIFEMVPPEIQCDGCQAINADVVETGHPWRHDTHKLARQLIEFYTDHKSKKVKGE